LAYLPLKKREKMIQSINHLIEAISSDLKKWAPEAKPWFRGESGDGRSLCPKIANYKLTEENYLLQSFRRQAGGLANVPPRDHTDMWLFLAQHYGVPTRLLDWTEGALHALYFVINREKPNPRLYMLNPRELNNLAGSRIFTPNYPLSWTGGGGLYVALAWQNRTLDPDQIMEAKKIGLKLDIPLAFPAIYQDTRMIAQRSCFTIHGEQLEPLQDILEKREIDTEKCFFEYRIDPKSRQVILRELSILGVSAATLFPDLDHLAEDLLNEMKGY